MGVALGLGLLLAWLAPGIERAVMSLATLAGIPAALICMSPGLGALTAAVADPAASQSIALYRGKRLWRSTATVLLMTAGLAAGGSVLFFVPGMLAAMGAGLALYITFIERESGLIAYIKGFEYLKGQAADSLLKLLPVIVLCIITSVLLHFVLAMGIVALIALLLATPYLLVYMHRLFENLRGIKGRIIFFRVSRHVRMRWTAAALAGATLPLILALLLLRLGQAANAFHLLASLI
jgi:hypothetical protein